MKYISATLKMALNALPFVVIGFAILLHVGGFELIEKLFNIGKWLALAFVGVAAILMFGEVD